VKKEPEDKAVPLHLVERRGAVALRVRVQPRASREELQGVREGALVVRLTAPPVEGAANKALARLLSRRLGVPPSAVAIESGTTSRNKLVVVTGLTAPELQARLHRRGPSEGGS
jgi:uncharacterized protein